MSGYTWREEPNWFRGVGIEAQTRWGGIPTESGQFSLCWRPSSIVPHVLLLILVDCCHLQRYIEKIRAFERE